MGKDVWVLASEPEAELAYLPLAAAVSDVGSLSRRAAENLFWLGRYLERAQSSLRLMRMVFDALGAAPALAGGQAEAYQTLLHALSQLTDSPLRAVATAPPLTEQLSTLLVDTHRPGSVAFDVQALIRAAEAVREHLTDDVLHVLVDLPAPLGTLSAGAAAEQSSACVQTLLTRLLALSGAVGADMEQGDGWRFLELGRCIERGQNLIGVLRGVFSGAAVAADLRHLVECLFAFVGGSQAHGQRASAPASAREVIERLLLDPRAPRGLAIQLHDIERHLEALPKTSAGPRLDPAARLALDASTRLRLLDVDRLTADGQLDRAALDQFLARGDHLLRALSDSLSADYFQPPVAPHALLSLPAEP